MMIAAASLSLCGCLSFGSIATRGTTFDEGVGALQNRAILLNIARANHHDPLYFVSVGSATAQGQTDLRLAAPPVTTGPGLTTTEKQLTFGVAGSTWLDNQTSTNVQLGVFSTHDFYVGLMTPLQLSEVDLLLRQGFPRELVFYLVIAKARITPPNGRPFYLYNEPRDAARYALFVKAIEVAMEHGLTTEVVPAPSPASPPTQTVAGQSNGAGAIQFVLKPDTAAPPIQECFDRALATSAANDDFDQLISEKKVTPNLCGGGAHQTASQDVYLDGPDKPASQVEVIFRSTYGIFQYLGGIMNSTEAAAPTLVDYGIPGEVTPPGELLHIEKRSGLSGCFTAVTYDGESLCVPQDGAALENTKDVFDILTALLALKQSPGDLPASQSVLIAP